MCTHNICYFGEIRKLLYRYPFLSGALTSQEVESTQFAKKTDYV